MPKLITVKEAAQILGLCPGSVYNRIYSHSIASHKLGRSRRVSITEIERLLQESLEPARPCQ